MRRSSHRSTQRFSAARGVLAAAIATAFAGGVHAEDHTGVWWIPEENGWGVYTVDYGSVITPIWYTFEQDGDAVWYIISGALPQPDGSYQADVFRVVGEPLGGSTETTAVGEATLRFEGRDILEFEYTIGEVTQTKVLERFGFGEREVVCEPGDPDRSDADNLTDLWWHPEQSGWGMNLVHIDDNLYLTWYSYGEDNQPDWYVAALAREGDGWSGGLARGTTGTPFDQIDGEPPSEGTEVVGEIAFTFSDGQTGEFTATIDGETISSPLERFVGSGTPPVCETVDVQPPDDKVTCYPPLHVGDELVIAVQNIPDGVDPDDVDFVSQLRRVTGPVEFEGVQTLSLDTHFASYLPGQYNGFPSLRDYYLVEDDTLVQLGSHDWHYLSNSETAAYVRTPPSALPLRYRQNETVTLTFESDGESAFGNVFSHYDVVETYELVGREDVTTEAGTFTQACKFEITQSRVGSVTQVSGEEETVDEYERTVTGTRWTHPSVGMVKESIDITLVSDPHNDGPSTARATSNTRLGAAIVDGVQYPPDDE